LLVARHHQRITRDLERRFLGSRLRDRSLERADLVLVRILADRGDERGCRLLNTDAASFPIAAMSAAFECSSGVSTSWPFIPVCAAKSLTPMCAPPASLLAFAVPIAFVAPAPPASPPTAEAIFTTVETPAAVLAISALTAASFPAAAAPAAAAAADLALKIAPCRLFAAPRTSVICEFIFVAALFRF